MGCYAVEGEGVFWPDTSVKIEVADGLAGIGSLFSFANGFLELLFQQIGGIPLGFHGLAENRVAPIVLLLHSARRFFHVIEHFWLDGSRVSNDGPGIGIDLQNRIKTGASDFERAGMLGHLRRNDTPKEGSGLQAQGKDLEQVKHFPAQEEYGDQHRANRQQFPERHAIAIGLKPFDHQAEDVESGEAEDECPKDVIGIAFFGGLKKDGHAERQDGRRSQLWRKNRRQQAEMGEFIDRGQQVQAGSPLWNGKILPSARGQIVKFYILFGTGSRG